MSSKPQDQRIKDVAKELQRLVVGSPRLGRAMTPPASSPLQHVTSGGTLLVSRSTRPSSLGVAAVVLMMVSR